MTFAYGVPEAQVYESQRGHGFTLPGEQECWALDVTSIVRPDAVALPAAPLVLDIGCGTGKFTRLIRDVLGRLGMAPVVHGIDASTAMLDVARRLDSSGIHYEHGDARAVDGPARFDLVVSCQVLDSFEEPAELLATWRQSLLRPGGYVLTVLSFSTAEGWANRTPADLARLPLATVTSVEPLIDASVRAGFGDVRGGFLPGVSQLYGGATTGLTGPVGSRYYTIGSAPAAPSGRADPAFVDTEHAVGEGPQASLVVADHHQR